VKTVKKVQTLVGPRVSWNESTAHTKTGPLREGRGAGDIVQLLGRIDVGGGGPEKLGPTGGNSFRDGGLGKNFTFWGME